VNLKKIIAEGRKRRSENRYVRDINRALDRTERMGRGLHGVDRLMDEVMHNGKGMRRNYDGS
jgi:anti-sigma regulatory factor (Ser/Thr protein kinase)